MREQNLLNSSKLDRNSGSINYEKANFSGSLYPKIQNNRTKIRMKTQKVDFKTLISSQSFTYAMNKMNELNNQNDRLPSNDFSPPIVSARTS
jgi:hypothetical protein